MKVKQAKTIELKNGDSFELKLNANAKDGDTVARELVFYCSDSVLVENSDTSQAVINAYTLDVDSEYEGGWAIVPCEGLESLTFIASADCTLTYRILV